MYWQCDQPKELCLLLADPRLCFIENRLGHNAKKKKRESSFLSLVLLQQKENFTSAYLCVKWMLYYEILPFYFIFFRNAKLNKSVNTCLHT